MELEIKKGRENVPAGKRGRKARVCARAADHQRSTRSERLATAAPERGSPLGKEQGGEGQGAFRRERACTGSSVLRAFICFGP